MFVVFPSSRVYKQLVALKEPSEQGWLVSRVAKSDIKTVRRCDIFFLLFTDARRTQALLDRMDTDKMARSLWTCDKELNSKQQEAIKEALKNHFQLIQGPPGYHQKLTGYHMM